MEPSRRASPSAHLPLKPADLHILMVLLDADRHGYGIMQRVAEESEGLVRLEVGSLYRIIARLEADGLLAEAPPKPGTDVRRRYYRLTSLGRLVARAEARRLVGVVRLARARQLLGAVASR